MRRWGALLGWAAVPTVIALSPLALLWADLPDPAATDWGIDGRPTGSAGLGFVPWILLAVIAAGLLVSAVFRVTGRPSAEAFIIVGFFGGLAAWMGAGLVMLNYGVPTWEEARPFDAWQVVGLLGTGALFGVAGHAIGRRWFPPDPVEADPTAPSMEVAPGERVLWTGSARVIWPYLVLAPIAAGLVFLPGWLKALSLVYLVLGHLLSRVTVVVDRRGLRVSFGGLVTGKRIDLDDVTMARQIDLEPKEWGGWGYRAVPGATAVVLRRGDAIEVVMANDRRFAVTVDDAATGAALLNGMARHRGAV